MELLNYASSSEIIGQSVTDTLGHDYGTLKDILFSPEHQKAVMAVIATSGSGHIALPFQALSINPNSLHVMADIDKQTIQNAPQVDLDLVREGREEEMDKIFTYYGYENFWNNVETKEPDPLYQSYKSGENTGERHAQRDGSYQETQQYPGSIGGGESNFKEEADYDKMKGLPKDKE
jgi:sporulation protein YlmC with PRC-barrel domain